MQSGLRNQPLKGKTRVAMQDFHSPRQGLDLDLRLIIGRESFHARSTLQQAEKSFQNQPMLRISRSCLVNMRHVKEISRTPRGDFILVVAGGTTVTSSEGYREPVRQYFERLKLAPA